MGGDEANSRDAYEDVEVRSGESLRSQVQRTWIARSRAKRSDGRTVRLLCIILLIVVAFVIWIDDLPNAGDPPFWESGLFLSALALVIGARIYGRYMSHRAQRMSMELTRMLLHEEDTACASDTEAAIAAINWPPSFAHRAKLASLVMPHLNELVQAERPDLDNMALESLTEVLRCARRPKAGYPSPELAIVCLKLIRKSDYLDALVQVEQ